MRGGGGGEEIRLSATDYRRHVERGVQKNAHASLLLFLLVVVATMSGLEFGLSSRMS